ncbi:uncharacterized protein BDR25DRAFT_301511 [Lindgomyces ingoldianus]|uniref:Uncharacterized protein n=1 Tax=Lindgomyces ingoldianus TaxID=673940 RepID=A0ACB6R6R9_9PLEO|nr:uncharacterized protein BDR25DRAFT_301511 [Lindgomyces ingoldianus]KAF2474959.1 hypothetical protein BDR25DRAFT_301511 [Lindgomyces ingoldianus]
MASVPSEPLAVSTSPSRTSPDGIGLVVESEARLPSLLSYDASSPSSTATTLHQSSSPHASTEERASVGPDSSIAQGGGHSSGSSTLASASHICERFRLAELDRDELCRTVEEVKANAEEERAIADRLKHEGAKSGVQLSVTEAKLRVLQLKQDMQAAGVESPKRSSVGLFKKVCSTDLLFLIDTTGSMAGHINAAKEQVKSIVNDIEVTFLNEANVRIAVVAYRDHSDNPNIQFLDFTDADRVRAFLNGLTAYGGGDEPEDVLGGIRQALNASWKQQTRCIIHIADAPPHGHSLQNSPIGGDSYPKPGSEPHRLKHETLLKQMVELKINYALLRINSTTDQMAFTFLQAYAAASADCSLHKSNMFYNEARSLAAKTQSGNSKRSAAKSGPLFEEAELGTTFSALRHLVVKMVTTSASRTAVRSTTRSSTGKLTDKKLDMHLAAINEDEDDVGHARLETTPPQWDRLSWFNDTLMVEGFSPDVVVHGDNTLDDMMAHDDNILMSITELTIHKRSRPFAQGAMRVAFYARTAASTNRFVVKSFKRGRKRLAHLAEDMRCQALCKAFTLEFNALSGEDHGIDFIVTTCLKGMLGMGSDDECMSLEPFIEGTYVKYNNNCGYVNEDDPSDRFNQAAQAFSHFTFERSRGCFLVSDLQGVGHRLTDPAIHTLDPERFKLSDTNLGKEGFKFFFATHVCNDICRKLGLESNASMLMSGNYTFKEKWPSIDNTVCCSNKLCGRIVSLVSAKESDNFPGYHWCDGCWPQLCSSVVKWICIAPGPHHEFEVSEFFSESQGRGMPRKCPEHREKDAITLVARRAVPKPVQKSALPPASRSIYSRIFPCFAAESSTVRRMPPSKQPQMRTVAQHPRPRKQDASLWDRMKFASRKKSSTSKKS